MIWELIKYIGRVVAQFEEYPGLPHGHNRRSPLMALRFLEIFTPVRRLSDDEYMQSPKPGELLTVRQGNTGEYAPWGFNPTNATARKVIQDLIANLRTADNNGR